MMKTLQIVTAGLVLFTSLSFFSNDELVTRKDKLSEYGFFKGDIRQLDPDVSVIPYTLNTPLFSNYSEKLRFVKLPDGGKATYNDTVAFEFPPGTVLIKNFYFPFDFRNPSKGRRLIETRLLVNVGGSWEAWPYIWNDDQSDAYYDPAGETKIVSYVDPLGKKVTTSYMVPNKNQCKGCHIRGQKMVPIGPVARQLNGDYDYKTGTLNQLEYWKDHGYLQDANNLKTAPRLATWNDPATGSLDKRARAYLDVNCGHCHSRTGPANTSGLFLDIYENDPAHLGVHKAPVAAGRGSGDLQFDIVPGSPQHSILALRMKTNDPAIAMPEIGRERIHKEGVSLIEEWIRKNSF